MKMRRFTISDENAFWDAFLLWIKESSRRFFTRSQTWKIEQCGAWRIEFQEGVLGVRVLSNSFHIIFTINLDRIRIKSGLHPHHVMRNRWRKRSVAPIRVPKRHLESSFWLRWWWIWIAWRCEKRRYKNSL